MQTGKKLAETTVDSMYAAVEADANIFNLKCMRVLCSLVLVCEGLNEFGIFSVPKAIMRPASVASFCLFAVPIIVSAVYGAGRHERPIVEESWFKTVIIVSVYLGISIICVTLSMHAVLLMTIPPLIAAQYRDQKRVFTWTIISTVLLVPIGVYGGYFFGSLDRNLFKNMLTDEEALVFANRVKIATSKRMFELLYHYVFPRIFCMIVVAILATGISRRNGKLLDREAELTKKVREEMERRNGMQSRVIDDLSALIETRDVGTGEHVIRTKEYVRMIALEMQKKPEYRDILTDDVIDDIVNAAPLHDVGKIAISDVILLKPGKLTKEEFDEMKKHTVKGGDMIENIFANLEDPSFLRTAKEIAISHHEKWDGSGYPAGLSGEEIPIAARIMAVADVFDALVSKRAYKAPMSPESAFEILVSETGTHFDPGIMEVVCSIKDQFISYSKRPIVR